MGEGRGLGCPFWLFQLSVYIFHSRLLLIHVAVGVELTACGSSQGARAVVDEHDSAVAGFNNVPFLVIVAVVLPVRILRSAGIQHNHGGNIYQPAILEPSALAPPQRSI